MPWATQIKKTILDAYFDGITLSIGLLLDTYVADPDIDFIDDGSANDIASHEITDGSYARKSVVLGSGGWTVDDASNLVSFDIADQTWSNLAGPETMDQFFVANNAGGADTARVVIGTGAFSSHTSDGNDFTLLVSELLRGINS